MPSFVRRLGSFVFLACLISIAASAQQFKAGIAQRDITPQAPMPMWGYGARHDVLSTGVMDPLYAKALVLDTGTDKAAIVTMDLGRGPTAAMMDVIRAAVAEKVGVSHVVISGSHTHHGPVIELIDEPDKGQGKFQAAVDYSKALPGILIDAIVEASANVQDARVGWASKDVDLNRNRQSKIEPKPRDTELTVVRFDDSAGKPLAVLVNFAAHPTIIPGEDLRFSAEWPGQMMKSVEEALGTRCMFVQGAAGDMSVNKPEENMTYEEFGKVMGKEVLAISEGITTSVPEKPSIQGMEDSFEYAPRLDPNNSMVKAMLKGAFFPEFVDAFLVEMADGKIHPHLTTLLINDSIYWVGVSGEFFCNHSVRLKERARIGQVVVQGYCNGHHLYFPTIEQAAEGGYGADSSVSWVPIGAGEEIMNRALANLYS
ncbi:MAG: neutral/alkaline non-lysosomal ceramidase N-terminal domain-containing protein, partial [Candidatus Hydrogenedentales bacterium]